MAKEVDAEESKKLVMFPGVRRERLGDQSQNPEHDTQPEARTSKQVLQAAIDNDLTDVALIGLLPDGSIYVASETDDGDAVAGKFLRAANYMTEIEYDFE